MKLKIVIPFDKDAALEVAIRYFGALAAVSVIIGVSFVIIKWVPFPWSTLILIILSLAVASVVAGIRSARKSNNKGPLK